MKNIELEIRSFLSKTEYRKLLRFFKKNAKFIRQDNQITYYFDCPQDLRIQKNNRFAKIWLKSGKIHDEAREEIEIKFDRLDFEDLEKLFLILRYKVQIKWFRKRYEFIWKNINVCLDHTKGYGYIIELEKIASVSKKDIVLGDLKKELKTLDIALTSKKEFDKKYLYYQKNWKKLI